MPKSRKRGGEKAHRKRIQKVNNLRKSTFMKQQKLFNDTLELMKQQYTAETENNTTSEDATEPVQSTTEL